MKLTFVSNKVNLLLLEQMGIYPDASIRAKRPQLKSVVIGVIAIARMRYCPWNEKVNGRRLKDDWAAHKKGGKEVKESLKRMKARKAIGVLV